MEVKLDTSTGVTLSIDRYNDLVEAERWLRDVMNQWRLLLHALQKIRDGHTAPYGPDRRALTSEELRSIAREALVVDLSSIDLSRVHAKAEGR